ncbi:MAG TPA: cytochrome c maturation protein CcmE [Acidimicrobiia bacterium]|nr:cytochrome c maturation protein CcmE [Acidimicrobiia bacterium]
MTDTTDATPPAPAPAKTKIKWQYVVVAVLCVGAVGWMLVLMQRNVVFFKTVSEAVTDQQSDGTRSMRIGGGVVPGSIRENVQGVDFDLYEGGVTVTVNHVGNEPSLFQDCAPVVAEGKWAAVGTKTFNSTKLLIKHGNDYRPPEDSKTKCPDDPFKDQ